MRQCQLGWESCIASLISHSQHRARSSGESWDTTDETPFHVETEVNNKTRKSQLKEILRCCGEHVIRELSSLGLSGPVLNQALTKGFNIPAARSFMDNTENSTSNFSFLSLELYKLQHCFSMRGRKRAREKNEWMNVIFLWLKKFLTVKTRNWLGYSKRHIMPMPEHTMERKSFCPPKNGSTGQLLEWKSTVRKGDFRRAKNGVKEVTWLSQINARDLAVVSSSEREGGHEGMRTEVTQGKVSWTRPHSRWGSRVRWEFKFATKTSTHHLYEMSRIS